MFLKVLISKECIFTGNCWYFLNKGFKFHKSVVNGYHDVSAMSYYREEISKFLQEAFGDQWCGMMSRWKNWCLNQNETFEEPKKN